MADPSMFDPSMFDPSMLNSLLWSIIMAPEHTLFDLAVRMDLYKTFCVNKAATKSHFIMILMNHVLKAF